MESQSEHVHMRNDNPSPPPTENPAIPLIQEDSSPLTPNRKEFDAEYPSWPSLPPSTTDSQFDDKPPPRSKQWLRGFEKPSFTRIAILTVLCLITYPAFYVLTLIAKDRSLFAVRLIVSTWCSGLGFALGYILLKIGAQHIEAAAWATVIHMSHEGGGMKLRDLAGSSSNPTSFVPALYVLRSRFRNRETSRHSRKSYDNRPWFLVLGFFVILATLGPLLPFLFGRVVGIETFVRNQRNVYREVLIAGDLSRGDVKRAAAQFVASKHFAETWTLLPYGRSTSETTEFVYGNDTVYFAQPSLLQFVPGGSGAGTFNQPELINIKDTPNNTIPLTGRNAPKSNTGVVLRYPQWGTRIHCVKLPNPEVNLIPLSSQNDTYIFLPKDLLRSLFGVYGMDIPPPFMEDGLDPSDPVPSGVDPSTISYVVKMADTGVGISADAVMYAEPDGTDYPGYTAVETVVIRLNTSFTPSGRFPVYSNRTLQDINGTETKVGYDAAVCLQKYDPWIVESYNTSIVSPSALRIVDKGYNITSPSPSGKIRGAPIANTRFLNTTGKDVAFWVAHSNGVNQIWKDNDRGSSYVPSPTVVAFTEGTGPGGYVELSPDRLAIIRARAGAANSLPYLAGSGAVVAQLYEDETLAYSTFKQWQLIGLPIIIWVLGVIGELFVPTLPLNVPRREFGVYSWLALLQSRELRFEASDELDKFMSLNELEEKFSDKRVEFVV